MVNIARTITLFFFMMMMMYDHHDDDDDDDDNDDDDDHGRTGRAFRAFPGRPWLRTQYGIGHKMGRRKGREIRKS